MRNLYWKIETGWNPEDYIEINQDELEKAFYCALEKKDAVYSGGFIRGSKIEQIKPDYHRIMGWNRGYKLNNLDYEDISDNKIDEKVRNIELNTKNKIDYLIKSNQINLIGQNIVIPELEDKQSPEIKKISDNLTEKFKI